MRRKNLKFGGKCTKYFLQNFELGNQAQGHTQTPFPSIPATLELLQIKAHLNVANSNSDNGNEAVQPGNIHPTIYIPFNLH